MQMPKSSASTDSHIVKVFQDNVPGAWLRVWLVGLGWVVASSSREKLELRANRPKAVGEMAGLHHLSGKTL
eukprot:2207516-Pleurochrysis_carterae.AAC.1